MKPKDYPCKVLEERINSTNVSIIGVSHDPSFFFQHREFLEEKIRQADALVLECEPYFPDGFFDQVGNIAYSQKKRVYHADPMNKFTQKIDKIQGGSGLGLAVSSILTGQTYALPLGLYFFLGNLFGGVVRYIPSGILAATKGTDPDPNNYYDILFYGETDYRNVMIAEGITKISSEINDVKSLACIHGAAHTRPVKVYLKNPNLRKAKKLLYSMTYGLKSEKKVREYTPDEKGWMLTKKF
ncbi:hypothetical protein FJZ53_02695 [Candidatus Woesearchaeota archaeon]|nr:hypothetical protein [Candidatus Woesearchaeota archaeon]